MGRIIIADERVQSCINSLFGKEEWTIGLLVGQITSQKDYVVHLVKTPPAEIDAGETASRPRSLDKVDELWVATHTRQVLRMLPGGLSIIGIFVLANQDAMKNAQLQLRKVLFAVQKVISKAQSLTPDSEEHMDRAVVQICSLSKKVTCKTYDVSDLKCAARPGEWKVQSFIDSWIPLESSLTVDHVIPIAQSSLSSNIKKQIQVGVTPLIQNVWAGLATVNGELRPDTDLLDVSHGGSQNRKSKKGQHEKESTPRSKCSIHLLLTMVTNNNSIGEVVTTDCFARMRLRGTISSRAYVHGKTLVKDAVKVIKRDIVQSLLSRCDLLCEDLLQSEEDQDPRVLYETPVRIFGQVPSTPLTFCDYMFQDETASDSLDRFRDLLDINLSEKDLDMSIEHVPNEEDLIKPQVVLRKDKGKQADTKATVINLISLAAGGVVAAMAVGISYLLLDDK